MAAEKETTSRKLLKKEFDSLLIPLGFRRSFSTWIRNNEETTFGVNIERWPLFEAYYINFWIWIAPDVQSQRNNPPDLAIRPEDFFEGDARGQCLLRCDFEMYTATDEDQAKEIANYVSELGLPWFEKHRDAAGIKAAWVDNNGRLTRWLSPGGFQKVRKLVDPTFRGA